MHSVLFDEGTFKKLGVEQREKKEMNKEDEIFILELDRCQWSHKFEAFRFSSLHHPSDSFDSSTDLVVHVWSGLGHRCGIARRRDVPHSERKDPDRI